MITRLSRNKGMRNGDESLEAEIVSSRVEVSPT